MDYEQLLEEYKEFQLEYPKPPNRNAYELYKAARENYGKAEILAATKRFRKDVEGKPLDKIPEASNFLNPGYKGKVTWYIHDNKRQKQEASKRECLICNHEQAFIGTTICDFCRKPGGDPDLTEEDIRFWREELKQEEAGVQPRRFKEDDKKWFNHFQKIIESRAEERIRDNRFIDKINKIVVGVG